MLAKRRRLSDPLQVDFERVKPRDCESGGFAGRDRQLGGSRRAQFIVSSRERTDHPAVDLLLAGPQRIAVFCGNGRKDGARLCRKVRAVSAGPVAAVDKRGQPAAAFEIAHPAP